MVYGATNGVLGMCVAVVGLLWMLVCCASITSKKVNQLLKDESEET